MSLRIMINVSTYTPGNLEYARILQGIEYRFIATQDQMHALHLQSEPVYKDGIEMLQQYFVERTPRAPGSSIHRMFGKYEGLIEPSITVEFSAPVNDLPRIKQQVIEFGQRFRQETVHIAYSLRGVATPIEKGSPIRAHRNRKNVVHPGFSSSGSH